VVQRLAFRMASITRTLVTTVERLSDGDAIVAVSDNGIKLRIRLLGIDASESAQG